jgi:hypothetical protein
MAAEPAVAVARDAAATSAQGDKRDHREAQFEGRRPRRRLVHTALWQARSLVDARL